MATETKKPTTKKATAKKTTTTKKATAAKKVEKVVEEKAVVAEPVVKEKRKFKPDDLIPVVNLFEGTTSFVGKRTRNLYEWIGLGTVEYMEYQDLRAQALGNSSFIYEPTIVVQDNDFIEEFPKLKKVYKNLVPYEKMLDVIKNGTKNDLKEMLATLPLIQREQVKNVVSTLILNEQFDSLSKINLIDEMFNVNLKDLIEA